MTAVRRGSAVDALLADARSGLDREPAPVLLDLIALMLTGLGLVVLVAITVLNVYKPRGITWYGRRKQEDERRRRHEQRPAPVD